MGGGGPIAPNLLVLLAVFFAIAVVVGGD